MFKASPLKPGIWGETLVMMSKQLVSRETMQTNRALTTKKKEMGFRQTLL
jgi:hypothetical protein